MKKFMFLSLIFLSVSVAQAADQRTQPITINRPNGGTTYDCQYGSLLRSFNPFTPPKYVFVPNTPSPVNAPVKAPVEIFVASPGTPVFVPKTPSPVKRRFSIEKLSPNKQLKTRYAAQEARYAKEEFDKRSKKNLNRGLTGLSLLLEK